MRTNLHTGKELNRENARVHHYHCPLDGTQLVDAALGLLACPKCKTVYVPTINEAEDEFSLYWKEYKDNG
jgi:uncharacterized Zn finger protein (UPF0148 family)